MSSQTSSEDASPLAALRALAEETTGIVLPAAKAPMVEARVRPRMVALGLDDHDSYAKRLRADGEELMRFVDAVSTNHTEFGREPAHFDLLRRHVTELVSTGSRRIRVWCAAAATGQEAYTIAMTIAEAIGDANVDWRVLASDISTRALATAAAGVYPRDSIAKLTDELQRRYFEPIDDASCRVLSRISDRIVFRRINLVERPFPLSGPLEAVFCRNVLMYFEPAARERAIRDLAALLRPTGLLCVGHSETGAVRGSGFKAVGTGAYVRGDENDRRQGHRAVAGQ